MEFLRIFGAGRARESRCDTCVYARVVRGYVAGEKVTFCNRAAAPVCMPFVVSDCTDYYDRGVAASAPAKRAGFATSEDPERLALQIA